MNVGVLFNSRKLAIITHNSTVVSGKMTFANVNDDYVIVACFCLL